MSWDAPLSGERELKESAPRPGGHSRNVSIMSRIASNILNKRLSLDGLFRMSFP